MEKVGNMGAVLILVFACLVATAMVVQYFWVLSIKEDPSDWNGTLIKYKNMVRVAVIGSLVFFFTGTMIVAFDWWVFINPPGNHLGLTEGLNHFRTKYGGSLILLFMTSLQV